MIILCGCRQGLFPPTYFLIFDVLYPEEDCPFGFGIIDISKNRLLDDEAYKYNIYVDNLIIGNTYWFSIEPMDKTKQGSRRFFYNNTQIGDFKLISINNGDVINQHASLYFRLYSKQNNYDFRELPYRFDIENDYTKDINLITEIQIYDGYIKNLEQSLFDKCPKTTEFEIEDNDSLNVTVTVVCDELSDTPIDNAYVYLIDKNTGELIAGGITQDGGICTLCNVDIDNGWSFSEVGDFADITEGEYILLATLRDYEGILNDIYIDAEHNEFELRLEWSSNYSA